MNEKDQSGDGLATGTVPAGLTSEDRPERLETPQLPHHVKKEFVTVTLIYDGK